MQLNMAEMMAVCAYSGVFVNHSLFAKSTVQFAAVLRHFGRDITFQLSTESKDRDKASRFWQIIVI